MYESKKSYKPSPAAKPNGDTNRSLVDIEVALAKEFQYQKNIVAFNVIGESYILPIFHECDMLVCSLKSRLLTEVEIKRTWADFCADFKKRHHHETSSERLEINAFWYAVPEGIYNKCVEKLIEEKVVPSGIITYDEDLNMKRHKALISWDPACEGRWINSTYHLVAPFGGDLKVTEVAKLVSSGTAFKLPFPDGNYKDVTIIPVYNARPMFTEQVLKLAQLASMRQVSLRERISVMDSKKDK